jgi:hypothetical protein
MRPPDRVRILPLLPFGVRPPSGAEAFAVV